MTTMNTSRKTKTSDLLLDTAQELMLREGYRAVSVDRIIETAGVSKGTFFYHFNSKEILAVKLFERFIEQRGAFFSLLIKEAEETETEPLAKLHKILDRIHEPFFWMGCDQPGCILGSFSYQLLDEIPVLKTIAQNAIKGWTTAFKPYLEAAINTGKENSADLENLAVMLFVIIQGSAITSRLLGENDTTKLQVQQFKNYLDLLSKQ